MDFITVPDRNEVRESGQEVMHYFIFKCPEKGVLGSTDPICNCSKDVREVEMNKSAMEIIPLPFHLGRHYLFTLVEVQIMINGY